MRHDASQLKHSNLQNNMIALIALILTFAGAILAEIMMVGYKKFSRKPGRAFGYSMVGFLLCLSIGFFFGFVLDGFIFIIRGFNTTFTQEILCTIAGGVVGSLFFIGTLGLWFSSVDEQKVVAVQDPFGSFFPYHPGIVGTAPWLIRKPGWEIKTTSEIKMNVVVNLECSNGVILQNATIQVVCRVDENDPMRYLDLDDDIEEREKAATEAVSLEVRRVANNWSIRYTDDQLMANAGPIKTAIINHMRDENGCGGILRGMSLHFDRIAMGDFDRDPESAEAARLRSLTEKQLQSAQMLRDGLNVPGDVALNATLAIGNQNTTREVWSIEGLSQISPDVAKAVGSGMAMMAQGRGRGGRGGNNQGNRNRGNRRGGRGRGGRGGNNQPS